MGHHHHGHDHDHHHGPGHVHVHVPAGADPRTALIWALILNGGFLVAEAGIGWWTGSLALLSDAAHMLSDVAALVLALAAAQAARLGPTFAMTFGLRRAETLGAYTNGLALLVACAWIVYEALSRLLGETPEVAGLPVLIVGVLGLAINLGSAYALWRSDRDNLNIRAALAHMLADALGSVGAIAAAGALFLGWNAADAWISLAIAALVAWSAVRVTRDSGRVLLELPPPGFDVEALQQALLAVEGVDDVHDLHVWSLDGHNPLVSAHLVVADDGDATCARTRALLHDDWGVEHATLQVEAPEAGCAQVDCGATAVAK